MKRWSATLRSAFLVTSVGWTAVLPLTSWIAGRAHAPSLLYAAAATVYTIGALVCHQLPVRSFQLWAVQMPVCARCVGIYGGAAIASVLSGCVGRAFQASHVRSAESLALRVTRLAILAAVAPTALTLVYEWWSGQMPANWIRAASGVPIGVMVTALVVAATGDQVN